MADVEIKGKISVDSGNATKSTNELIDALRSSKKALADAKVGSVEYKAAQENLKKSTKDLDDAVSKNGGSFSKLKETLGNTIPGFQGASQGASGLGKQLWLLVANPIVAVVALLVAGLMLLYKAFTSTNEGADKMGQIMAGIGATVEVLRDRVLKVGEAIGKFFSGDFKGALEVGKAAVKGIGQEIADEFSAAAQATKTLQDLEDAMRNISVNRAKLNRDLAQAKEIMNSSDATFAQRTEALNKVRVAEKKQSEDELAAARTKYNALKQDAELTKNVGDDKLNALADAKAAVYNLEASSAAQNRAINKMDNTLRREEQGKADAAQKAREAKQKTDKEAKDKSEKERMDKYVGNLKSFNNEQIDALNTGLEMEKQADADKDLLHQKEIERASSLAQIRETDYNQDKARKEQEKLDDRALLDYKISVYSEQLNALQMLGSTIQQFAGKSKAAMIAGIVIEKAAAIGKILISGYVANAKALRDFGLPAAVPFITAGRIMTGLQVAGTVASAAKAIGAMGGGGSGGGVSMPSMSTSAPLSPQQSGTTLDQKSIQGIGNAAQGGVSRSFVLESDIKTNRERVERLNKAARF